MRYLKIFILLIILSSSLFGLSRIQVENLQLAYEIGKTVKAPDGMTFGIALSTIMLNETSGGLFVIGDKYHDIYYIIHDKKEIIIKNKKRLTHMYYKGYYKKIRVHKGQLKSVEDCSLGKFQIKLSTAKMLIKHYNRLFKYRKYLNNNKKLVNLLLLNDKFSAEIAGMYLLNRYELAKKRKYYRPYRRAISAYNGGWYNKQYLKKFKRNIRIVLHLKKYCSWK